MYNSELNLTHALHGVALARRWESVLRSLLVNTPDLGEIQQLEADIEAYLEASSNHRGVRPWRVALAWSRVLRCDVGIRTAAKAGGKVADERERLAVLNQELAEAIAAVDEDAGLRTSHNTVHSRRKLQRLDTLCLTATKDSGRSDHDPADTTDV